MKMFVGNKILMILTALVGVGILISLAVLIESNRKEHIVVTPPTVSLNPTEKPPLVSKVNIFLVALNDNGKSGMAIGCGDSLVPVTLNISPTTAPLKTALEQLLSIKTQYYGQSGLYNALYQSDLKVDSVTVDKDERATVRLIGSVKLGGVCDDPRFEQQIKQTILQFPTVKSTSIFINGLPLEQVTSEK